MRIVSLACSNTEIVCALGCAHLLVGVDDHSDYPPEVVAELPKVGPDLGIDIDRVAALEPDLVLATLTVDGHEKVVAGLEQAGLPYIAPEPVSLDDVYRDIADIADRLGVRPRGDDLVARMRATLAAVPPVERPPRILLQWWPKPVISPGRLSWMTDVIAAAGGVNPLAEEEVKSRPLSLDEVAALEPDAMVLSWCGVAPDKVRPEVVRREAAWQDLPFLRRDHIYCIPEAVTGRPSPRLIEGFRALRQVVAAVSSGSNS
ncbi:MAG: cobalamin-binding protein [Acidobacteriota bacterium]